MILTPIRQKSKEQINPLEFSQTDPDGLMIGKDKKTIQTVKDWENKKRAVLQNIRWIMGDPPGIVTNPGVGEDYFGSFLSHQKKPVK